MTLLLAGLIVFIGIHLVPVWSPSTRIFIAAKIGNPGYRGLHSIITLGSLYLIMQGWPEADATQLYDLGAAGRHPQLLLMPIAFILAAASVLKSWFSKIIRYQLLTGVKIWAFGHLLANGEVRSLLLFGGFLLWAVLMVIGSKKRDGAWVKPEKTGLISTIAAISFGLIVFYGIATHHSLLFGVTALPDWAH